MTSRTRSRSSLRLNTNDSLSLNASCSQTGWTVVGTNLGALSGVSETMIDTIIPDFEKRRAEGELFFNSLNHEVLTATCPSGNSNHRRSTGSITCSGQTRHPEVKNSRSALDGHYLTLYGLPAGTFPTPKSLLFSNDMESLVTEVATKVASEQGRGGGSNLYETVAQANQIASTIPDLVNRARKVVKGHGSKKAINAAGMYLIYRYGLRPLMSDISAVSKAVLDKVLTMRHTTRARGQIYTSLTETKTRIYSSGTDTILSQFGDRYEVRGMCLDEYYPSISNELGFTGKNLVTLPWELVPYSFVVDWFTNLGDLFGALAYPFSSSSRGGCIVTRRHRSVQVSAAGSTAIAPWTLVGAQSGDFTSSIDTTIRVPGIPTPGLVLRHSFNLSNVTRAADAISLLLLQMEKSRR